MAYTTITTSQAPDAKPVASNLEVTTNWQVIIEVPDYEVPELVFGGSTTVETGVGEVISPLMLCNYTANTVYVDLQSFRFTTGDYFYILRNFPVPGFDTVPIPINGQFFKSGDLLNLKCSVDDAVHATLSFTLGQAEEDDV